MENALIKWDNEQINLIKNTVAKGATDAELQLFIEFCKSTNLNPIKKEIWFIKTNNGPQIMTGIAGFLSIANAHPQYDGMEVSIEEQDGKLISATAKVYRKDRKYPSVATVYLSEYFRPSKYGNGLWEKMPRMMLQKVAKSVALREAFSQELNGIYTVEEMPLEYSQQEAEKPQEVEAIIEEPEIKPLHKYEISKFDKEKFNKAKDWCVRHNVEVEEVILPNDEVYYVAKCTDELPFFKEVEIK